MPLPGIAIVPVEKVGAGLIPGDASSVEPRGMPVGDTVEPVPKPSGEVAPMVGVGLAIPLTCAMAALLAKSAGMTAAISMNRVSVLRLPTARLQRAPMSISFATIPPGARLSDIGQSLSSGSKRLRKSLRRQVISFLSSATSDLGCRASYVTKPICCERVSGLHQKVTGPHELFN